MVIGIGSCRIGFFGTSQCSHTTKQVLNTAHEAGTATDANLLWEAAELAICHLDI